MNEKFEDSKLDDSLTAELANLKSPSNSFVENLTTSVLHHLSTASSHAIFGAAVALAAFIYLVLGNIGLILIGAVGGAVLHATWEQGNITSDTHTRKENSLDLLQRLLKYRETDHTDENDGAGYHMFCSSPEALQPETVAALNELVDAIMRDYVDWWYKPILPNDSLFTASCRQTLTRFLLSIAGHLSKKRAADSFLDFLTNSLSITIVFLSEISAALALSPGPVADAVDYYLSANPKSSLANVIDEEHQATKLKMITTDFLRNFLERSMYDCDPARIFLSETFGGLVLETTLKVCSQPEWINQWIVHILEKGEPDLSQAIDAGVGPDSERADIPNNETHSDRGNVGLAKSYVSTLEAQQQNSKKHDRSSKTMEDMDEATEEVRRLSDLIAEEDAKKKRASQVYLKDSNLSKIPETSDPKNYKFSTPERLDISRGSLGPRESCVSSTISYNNSSFTSFDQIVPNSLSAGVRDSSPPGSAKTNFVRLHHANITVYDDTSCHERGRLRNKPNVNHLIQIEPANPDQPGWMIVRRYMDFETLHEVLRRIAQVSGITAFTEQHPNLPSWKEHTKGTLRVELERYLCDACWYQSLADSEGMKRFLKKDDEQQMPVSGQKNGFPGLGWPSPSAFETMGKGVLDVLSNAPKGVAEGGKAITGVFNNIGNLGQRKSSNAVASHAEVPASNRHSSSTLPRIDALGTVNSSQTCQANEDQVRPFWVEEKKPTKTFSREQGPSYMPNPGDESHHERRISRSASSSLSRRRSIVVGQNTGRAPFHKGTPDYSPPRSEIGPFILPPPPSAINDDYGSEQKSGAASVHKYRKDSTPLTEPETRVAVELIFAVISEMYTLSSAWNIRRTLLTAAKTYLLRPGNPSLLQIQSLIQESVISANTSDAGIAGHLRELRLRCLPTEDELKRLPAPLTPEEKEQLQIKARRLLIERGVPTALMGVMGQAATSEAMGRIFDCLQIQELARGLMFGLLLQGLRAVTH